MYIIFHSTRNSIVAQYDVPFYFQVRWLSKYICLFMQYLTSFGKVLHTLLVWCIFQLSLYYVDALWIWNIFVFLVFYLWYIVWKYASWILCLFNLLLHLRYSSTPLSAYFSFFDIHRLFCGKKSAIHRCYVYDRISIFRCYMSCQVE